MPRNERMNVELVKPDPLIIGGRAHYTLTSYDPVTIEVDVPQVTDEEVELALQSVVMQNGGGPAELADDAWVRKTFEGMHNAAELRESLRAEIMDMNAKMTMDQKSAKCAQELSRRLVQRVPDKQVALVREELEQQMMASFEMQGLSADDFFAYAGMRREDMARMLDEQARESAANVAAVDAWADYKKVEVQEFELAPLMGVSFDAVDDFLATVRESGQMEQVKLVARQQKAMQDIVAECNCTYNHETASEAAARVERMRFEQQMMQQRMGARNDGSSSGNDHPHLKLV